MGQGLRSPLTSRRFAWLLWLGLLLPVAQLAAVDHAFSHARQAPARDDGGKQAPHAGHCDLGGAAPVALPVAIEPPALGESRPLHGADRATARTVVAYRSRAPPVAAC